MSSKKMADYLSPKTADYDYTLAISPHNVMREAGDKNQVITEFDDGSVDVTGISDQSYFTLTLQWKQGSGDTDHETILDLWHATAKANGRKRTFYWTHPVDGNSYTVRFLTPLVRAFSPGLIIDVEQITIRIEGNKPV